MRRFGWGLSTPPGNVSRKPGFRVGSREMLRRSLALLAVALVAVRIAYFAAYRAELPFWDAPIGDAEVYDAAARAMAAGDWLEPTIAYRPFLYPLWLGAAYSAFGPSPFAVYCLQALLGLATVGLC